MTLVDHRKHVIVPKVCGWFVTSEDRNKHTQSDRQPFGTNRIICCDDLNRAVYRPVSGGRGVEWISVRDPSGVPEVPGDRPVRPL